MSKNQIQLNIPKPCAVPWEEMQSVDADKRHCSSCDKVVVDFTNMSDEEVIRFFHKNGKACGQLTHDQLSRTFIPAPAKKNNFTIRQLFLLPSFLLSVSAAAQATIKQEPSSSIVSTVAHKNDTTGERLVIVKGFVSEIYTTRPIRTSIQISNGRDAVSVLSDSDGNYSIAISCLSTDSLTITASEDWSDHFSSIIQPVNGNDTLTCDVSLVRNAVVIASSIEKSPRLIGEIVTIKGDVVIKASPRTKARHFFYHLFHPFRKHRD
jgi:hypothetical protein